MDRESIARAYRRAEAEDALTAERDREAALHDAIALVATELEGPEIDAAAFARMSPDDADLARSILRGDHELPQDEEPDDESWQFFEDDEEGNEAFDPRAQAEAELARLEAEVAESRRSQQALEAYLAALDAG